MTTLLKIKSRIKSKLPPTKSQLGLCNNDKCQNKRRHGSAYCQKCSDEHKRSINSSKEK